MAEQDPSAVLGALLAPPHARRMTQGRTTDSRSGSVKPPVRSPSRRSRFRHCRRSAASAGALSGGLTGSLPTASRVPHGTASATVTSWPVSSSSAAIARSTSASGGTHTETSSATRSTFSVSFLRIAAGELLVRDHDPLLGRRAQDRVVEADVLDDAVVALERHPVADADRLRDREHDPGDEVGQRLAGGEADDRGGDRARGQQARRQLGDPGEARQRDRDADQQDHRVEQPAHEAQPRRALAGRPAPPRAAPRGPGTRGRSASRGRTRSGSRRPR